MLRPVPHPLRICRVFATCPRLPRARRYVRCLFAASSAVSYAAVPLLVQTACYLRPAQLRSRSLRSKAVLAGHSEAALRRDEQHRKGLRNAAVDNFRLHDSPNTTTSHTQYGLAARLKRKPRLYGCHRFSENPQALVQLAIGHYERWDKPDNLPLYPGVVKD